VDTYFLHWAEHSIQKEEGKRPPTTLSDNVVSTANAAAVDRAPCKVYISDLYYLTILDYKFFALVSTVVEIGNEVVIVNEAAVAYVVRRREDDERTSELVGQA
jgi:hypothetical protein